MSDVHDRSGSDEALEGGVLVLWNGDLKSGTGRLQFESGAGGELPLLWPGSEAHVAGATSPEELASAAHAACFAMTLAHTLARAGHTPREVTVTARATFGVVDRVRMVRRSRLQVSVDADDLSESDLSHAAELAGRYCPVSNTLRAGGVLFDVGTHVHSVATHPG
jgi:osmotically inducible protein OsmC